MKYNENQLKILVILSDEQGYSNKQLAKLIYGKESYKGNISTSTKPLMKAGEEIIEKLSSKTIYREFNLHIKKDKNIFKSIIGQLNKNKVESDTEEAKYGREFCILVENGDWCNERLIEISKVRYNCEQKKELYSNLLDTFSYSQYTGEIINLYGIEFVLSCMPRLKVKDFIKFVDWAEENKFVDTENYVMLVLSTSDYMIKQFEKRSPTFADIADTMKSIAENTD